MKKYIIFLIVTFFSTVSWGANKFEIDTTTPYIPGLISDCNSSVCWGSVNEVTKTLHRWDTSFTKTAGTAALAAGLSFREVFATSDDTQAFAVVVDADSKNALYRATSGGNTLTKVLELGKEGETWIADVWALQRGFAEVTINSVTTYLIGEYNVNGSRTDGSTNDQVRIMQSTNGTTWTPLVTWNTDGHTVRHIHAIKQDAATGYIYILMGDSDAESAIIRWDPATGTWADNLSYLTLSTRAGFKCAYGAQRNRAVDILFTTNYVHVFADTSGDNAETGIWRGTKDLSTYTRVNSDLTAYPTHYGWAGAVASDGTIIFTAGIPSSAADAQGGVWVSSDEGTTYARVGLIGYGTTYAGYSKVTSFDGKIVLGIGNGSGKHFADTAIIYNTGQTYAEEWPVVFHPVYFVATTGTDDSAADRGWKKSDPWQTVRFALVGNLMTYGSRLIIAAGSYPIDAQTSIEVNAATLPGTGMLIIEGSGSDSTAYYTTVNNGSTYCLYFGRENNQSYLIKKIKIYAEKPSGGAATVIYGGAYGKTGITVYVRDAIIGDPSTDSGEKAIGVFNTVNVARSKIYGSAGKIAVGFEVADASFTANNTMIIGGSHSIYRLDISGSTLSLKNCVLYGYTLYGVRFNTEIPTIKNTIFYGGTGNLTAIVDQGANNETDTQIDYNIFFDGYPPWDIANSGGSHSLNADPLFANPANGYYTLQASSPAINAGVDVGLTTDYAGNPLIGLPDIGAYETRALVSTFYASPTGSGSTCTALAPCASPQAAFDALTMIDGDTLVITGDFSAATLDLSAGGETGTIYVNGTFKLGTLIGKSGLALVGRAARITGPITFGNNAKLSSASIVHE